MNCYERKQINCIPILLFGLVLVAMVIPMYISVVNNGNNHAIEKHGLDTVMNVQYCLNQKGELQLWQKDNRFARLCELGNNLYGIEIVEKNGNVFEHITAFIKEKLHSLSQVENYLSNTGYIRIR